MAGVGIALGMNVAWLVMSMAFPLSSNGKALLWTGMTLISNPGEERQKCKEVVREMLSVVSVAAIDLVLDCQIALSRVVRGC